MEIKITTKQMLTVLYVLSWIIFIGLCIEAGGFIFNGFLSLFVNTNDAKYFWQLIDLSDLYKYDRGYFIVTILIIIFVAVLKAFLFYLIVKILYDKKLTLSRPFNTDVRRFISNLSYLALGIGVFSLVGFKYAEWFVKQGVNMPDAQHMRIAGADVWLLMGVILLVIAQIIKRGIEIQQENDLTV